MSSPNKPQPQASPPPPPPPLANQLPNESEPKGAANLVTCMLVTANVGTIFEEPTLFELWFQQLKSYLCQVRPQFVAIHCQEVGGKNYQSSTINVSDFSDKLVKDRDIVGRYTRIRIFFDENFESIEKFTALGSLYLVDQSVDSVEMFNFKVNQFESIECCKIYAGEQTDRSLDTAEHIEKEKFPQNLFPDCRWSRKGFMRTRWRLNGGQEFDLVNIHLFHDASNLVAMEFTPSPYAQNRQKALEFTLKRVSRPLPDDSNTKQQHSETTATTSETQQQSQVPLFIFGDFNFRLDTSKVVQRITAGLKPTVKRGLDGDEVVQYVYHGPSQAISQSGSGDQHTGAETSKRELTPKQEQARLDLKQQTSQQTSAPKSEPNVGAAAKASGGNDSIVMTVGKKLFDCQNLDETFRAVENNSWLLELDKELDSFREQLFEFKISFNPSYPFKEDASGGYSYMKTRCPAWCDRILFNAAGCRIIHDGLNDNAERLLLLQSEDYDKYLASVQEHSQVVYRLMGSMAPMGDHKPVVLCCHLKVKD